jgi:2-polyprenyl-3-methyl-5-hydroxy-6-metoxy-1,4-benzoquinol methylase
MEQKEQAYAYANADFSDSNGLFLEKLFEFCSITDETKILDVGCGDGEIPIEIYKKTKSKITVLDGSSAMLDEFSKKMSVNNVDDIKIIQRRYEDTHLSEKSFDILISNSVLHHVKSPKKFWEKSFNLVRQQGQIVLMDLFRPSSEHELLTILDKYGGNNPVLLNDFENSLRAAYTPYEVECQLSSFPSISSSVKAISDRHFFVTIEIKK